MQRGSGHRHGNGGQPSQGRDGYARQELFGALDLGTNNCRLLIATPRDQGRFRVLESYSRIVRLGEGLAVNGSLNEAAMERAIEALSVCASRLNRRQVTRVRAVATAACRNAGNRDDFIARVKERTGLVLEVIPESEEVRLAAEGCVSLLNGRQPYALLFDIGGGSTEVSWHRVVTRNTASRGLRYDFEIEDWCSLPLGVVNLSERYGGRDVSQTAYAAMRRDVSEAVRDFDRRTGLSDKVAAGEVQLLGTSGTVTTLVGVHLELPRYRRARVDGYRLPLDTLRRTNDRIVAMSYEERVREGCIGPERADLVISGCAILEALCDIWPVERLRVADRGLREGILWQLMGERPRADASPGLAAPAETDNSCAPQSGSH